MSGRDFWQTKPDFRTKACGPPLRLSDGPHCLRRRKTKMQREKRRPQCESHLFSYRRRAALACCLGTRNWPNR